MSDQEKQESGMGSQMEGEGEGEGEDYDGEMDDSAAEDDIFKNNHDLIGVQGILRAQKNEIEKKKVSFHILKKSNMRYIFTAWTENGEREIF